MRKRTRLLACIGGVAWCLSMPFGHAATLAFWQGNIYEYVPTFTTWEQAKAQAASMSFMDFPGRLATVTSAEEQAAIASIIPANQLVMLGGSDAAAEGTWAWETGPEAGTVFWKDGQPYGGAYANWRPGEPNHFYPTEDYLAMYQGQWVDSAANDFLHGGFVVEYRLTADGFDFGMNDSHMGAIRNISPSARLVRLDITLAGDTFIDSAAAAPGREFSAWSLVAASPGVSLVLPDNAATDGKQTVTLNLDLDPTEAVHFQVDLDRLSSPDGAGIAPGTLLTAYFSTGDLEYVITGTVQAGDLSILDTTFPYSVRSLNTAPIPEPSISLLFVAGLLVILGMRKRPGRQQSGQHALSPALGYRSSPKTY